MKKLKAGSLQLVTFIVVIIALLLAAFIILMHAHKQFRLKTDHIIETIALVDKGISYVLNDKVLQEDTITLALLDENYKSLKVHKSYWGTFEKVCIKASIKNNTLKKTALIGAKFVKDEPLALHLKENNKPLVLVGHTKIEGKAFLPKRGVKSGTISGQSYYNENYIYGELALSKTFPKIDNNLSNYIDLLSDDAPLDFDSAEHIDLSASKKHSNSFKKPLRLAYSYSDILLSDIAITGHIIIQSKTKISVDKSSKLNDIILVAPKIEIRDEVEGQFQAFATENISVAKNVSLKYPSALVLQNDDIKSTQSESHKIEVGNHSVIKGNVIVLGKTLPDNFDVQLKIFPNALIKGVVYCEQNLELRGTVYGTVYTDNFIIKELGSIYRNHLYNAKISSHALEPEFVNILLEDHEKGVAKWLY